MNIAINHFLNIFIIQYLTEIAIYVSLLWFIYSKRQLIYYIKAVNRNAIEIIFRLHWKNWNNYYKLKDKS
jgi:hypothetical protein